MAEFVENELNFHQLAKIHMTFANWRMSGGCTGESHVDFRQLASVQGVYWRVSTGLSPLAKVLLAKVILAKFRLAYALINGYLCKKKLVYKFDLP